MADPAHHQPPPNGWRTFLILWATQAFSVFGSMITQFTALAWLGGVVYAGEHQKAALGLATAAIGLADGLPMLFVAPIAGVWSDRYSRKTIMVVSNLMSALLSLLLVVLMAAQALEVWALVIILGLLNITSTFQVAAFEPTYVLLVPEKHLTRANGMTSAISSLSNILAPSIALMFLTLPQLIRGAPLPAPLINLFAVMSDGAQLAFTIDMITFFVAAVVPIFLFIPSVPQSDAQQTTEGNIWSEFYKGLQFVWTRRGLFWLLMTFAVTNLAVSAASALNILLIRFQVGDDVARLGMSFEQALAWYTTSGAVGGVLGGVLISAWGGLKRRRVYGVLGSMIVAGITLTVIGLSPFLYLTAAMVFLLDLVNPIGSTHFRTLWQTQVPPALQGRVVAVIRMIAQSTWPVGMLLGGTLGALLDVGWLLVCIGGMMTIFMISQLFNRTILSLDKLHSDDKDTPSQSQRPADQQSNVQAAMLEEDQAAAVGDNQINNPVATGR